MSADRSSMSGGLAALGAAHGDDPLQGEICEDCEDWFNVRSVGSQ